MQPGNKPEPPDSPRLVASLGGLYEAVVGLWQGTSGRIVRCVPTRWTAAQELADGWLFAKCRRGERARAAAEWRWLHVLPLMGLRTPRPVAWVGRGSRTMLVTRGVAGRPLDAWFVDAAREGWLPQLCAWACREVAPRVRALHAAGLVYRDLYWNHVVALDPRGDAPPMFLDVERVFRPLWRRRRWIVKDLAGLASSLPVAVAGRAPLRFLRAYDPVAARDRQWVRAIARKAARIRARAPRFG
ncbi:MAG: hypothetical protein FJ306_06915 [Planctomycetes bacterium]|nr:hypothetical protein [Planctomycetota bacterium]